MQSVRRGGRSSEACLHRIQPTDLASLRRAVASELRRSEAARYLHRLHAVLLVSVGHSCAVVAHGLGLSPRTVERWARAFEVEGVDALHYARAHGRPSSLSPEQRRQLLRELGRPPAALGYGQLRWSGKLLARHLEQQYAMKVGPRQCQRWLSHVGQADFRAEER